jgi:hypothetical protein
MRIALVCPYDVGAPGGVQQIVVELGRQLAAGNDEVLLVAPGEPTALLGVRFESVGG